MRHCVTKRIYLYRGQLCLSCLSAKVYPLLSRCCVALKTSKCLCGVVTICDWIQRHYKHFDGIFVVITKMILVFMIWSVLTHENTRHVHRKGYNFIKKCFILIDLLVAVCMYPRACQSW